MHIFKETCNRNQIFGSSTFVLFCRAVRSTDSLPLRPLCKPAGHVLVEDESRCLALASVDRSSPDPIGKPSYNQIAAVCVHFVIKPVASKFRFGDRQANAAMGNTAMT